MMDVAERGGCDESNLDNWVVVLRGSLRHGSANDEIDSLDQRSLLRHSSVLIAV